MMSVSIHGAMAIRCNGGATIPLLNHQDPARTSSFLTRDPLPYCS